MPPLGSAAVAVLLLATAPAPDVVLTVQDPLLEELSGLAASARHEGVLWAHEDGGESAQVVALDASGATVATVTLAGIDPYDPEALAPGRGGLYVGDIGDNLQERPDVSVFRFDEPRDLADATVEAQWYRFTYPDGPHDAEALLAGPSGRLYVATKDLAGAGLYRAPRDPVTEERGTNRLTRVADVPALVTDGAFLPDGRFVLRTYTSAYVYDRPGELAERIPLPAQPQGESVAVDGDRLLLGSEGANEQVLAVPLPASTRPAATRDPDAEDGGGDDRDEDRGLRDASRVARVVAVLLLLAAVAAALVRTRRRRR